MRSVAFAIVIAGLCCYTSVEPCRAAANQRFHAALDPAPFDTSTRASVAGVGEVSATIEGNTLVVTGTFSGLPSAAVAAHLGIGPAKGVEGEMIASLTITRGTKGALSGRAPLDTEQIRALNRGALYIRVDSEKAPDGHLQGWLEASGERGAP